MSTPDKSKITLAIAGGGIAGLALAAGLYSKYPHIDFHVYEGAKEYKDIGAGLAIHGNGINSLGLIHPGLKQAYFDKGLLMGEEGIEVSTEVVVAQGPFKGEVVANLGRAKNRKTVSRADLLDGFSSLIPKDKVTFRKRLEGIVQDGEGVQLTFQDGEKVRADCLIGADGIHSPTRRYILGPDHPACEPVNTDNWHIYRTIIPMSVAAENGVSERWQKGIPIMLGARGYMNSLPLNKGTRLAISVCESNVKFDKDGNAPSLDPEKFEDYDEDARNFVKLIVKDDLSWITADHDPAPIYFKDRVCMVGDAAHATHAFNGQGAAQALEDVAVLNALFGHLKSASQLPVLFSAFDEIRRPRSQKVVELSRKFGRMYEFRWGDVHNDLDAMRREFGAGGNYTNNFDVGKQNEDAVEVFQRLVNTQMNGNGKTH